MQKKPRDIKLYCDLEVRYAKWQNKYKAISDEYRLVGRSDVSFEEAQADLLNQIDLEIWTNPLNIKYNIKEKK